MLVYGLAGVPLPGGTADASTNQVVWARAGLATASARKNANAWRTGRMGILRGQGTRRVPATCVRASGLASILPRTGGLSTRGSQARARETVEHVVHGPAVLLDVAAQQPLALQAGLLEHAPRGRVPREVVREDTLEAEPVEGVLDQRAHGLARDAAAPVRARDPVAELGAPVRGLDLQPRCAEQLALRQAHGPHGAPARLPGFAVSRDPGLGQ